MKKIFLLFVACLMWAISTAQVLFVKDVNEVVSSGAVLKIIDLKTEGNATLFINGELQIGGNLINDTAYGFLPGDGKVTFNGAQQNIGGSFPIYFPGLNISGTGKKILQQNIFTGNTLSLNDDILMLNKQVLHLNSKQLTILSSSANAILKSGNGFVESETNPQSGYGYLQWNVKNNTGNYVFPFGNSIANIYLPLTMDIMQAGTSNNGFIRAAIYPTDVTQNPNNRPFPVGVTNMNNIAGQDVASKTTDRFWLLETSNYTINPIADLQLSFLENEWNSSNGSTDKTNEE